MKGGEVYIPSGTYRLNHAIMHKGMSAGPVDLPAAVPGAYGTPGGFVTYRGEGASTILVETVDLGAHQCAFGVASRAYYVNDNTAAGYRDPADFATYRDFALYGGNNGAIGKRNLGEIPTENDGICISGGGTLVSNVLVQHFHAGVNISGDHLTIEGLTTGFDGYGIYTEPYNASGGGFFIRNSNFSGNYIAGVGEASTGGIDSSQLLNVYMGYQPFAFYMERTPANLSSAYNSGYQSGQSYDLLSNSTLRDVYSEAHGNGIIYDANGAGQVVNNSITGGSVWSMGLGVGSGSYWSGAPKKAMISVGQFAGNTMIATQWGTNSGYVTDATISAYSVSSNVWLGDVGFVTSGTAKIPAIVSGSPPMGNTFVGSSPGAGPSYRGYFGYIGGTIASAGLPLSYNAENYVVPYIAGHGFAGVSLTPAAASSAGGFVAVAVATEGNNVKVVPSPTLSPQLPAHRFVYPTSDGFAEAMSSAHAVGYSGYGLNAGAVEIALNPLLDKGENGSANDLTASGGATFTGSVAGNTLRLTAGPYTGALAVGQAIAGLNVAPGTMISGKDGADWHVTPAQNVANGGLTSGYAIENNINEFTKVAPGAIAVLNTYTPIGTSELICNDDTSNSLVVYPAPGATFVGAMLNATIAANTCQSFTKIGAGRWN
jgi:hypothetical protein